MTENVDKWLAARRAEIDAILGIQTSLAEAERDVERLGDELEKAQAREERLRKSLEEQLAQHNDELSDWPPQEDPQSE